MRTQQQATNDDDQPTRWLTFVSEKERREYYYDPKNKLATWILPSGAEHLSADDLKETHNYQNRKAKRQVWFQNAGIGPSLVETPIRNQHDELHTIIRPVFRRVLSILMSSSCSWIMLALNVILGLISLQVLEVPNLSGRLEKFKPSSSHPGIHKFMTEVLVGPLDQRRHGFDIIVQERQGKNVCHSETETALRHQPRPSKAESETTTMNVINKNGTLAETNPLMHATSSKRGSVGINTAKHDEVADAIGKSGESSDQGTISDLPMQKHGLQKGTMTTKQSAPSTDEVDNRNCLVPFAYIFSKKCRQLATAKHPIQTDHLLNIIME
jgi:hypothetical protein